ncbi:MAG: ATP-binding protein [bacterium]
MVEERVANIIEYHERIDNFMRQSAREMNISPEEFESERVTLGVKTQVDVVIPSKSSYVDLVRRIITGLLTGMDVPEKMRVDIGLAVDEACSNVIKHSYGEDEDGEVEVFFVFKPGRLEVTIVDKGSRGQFFNIETKGVLDKDTYLAKLKGGGLGVYLMKTVMDEVEYDTIPEVYNVLRMVKYLPVRQTISEARGRAGGGN